MKDWKASANRSKKLLRDKGLRGGSYGPAGPAISLVTGEVYDYKKLPELPDSDLIVRIYTDGSCNPNPGFGGWAAILAYKGHERSISGGAVDTTNNRMELEAAIQGLQVLTRPCRVILYSDSQYLVNTMNLDWTKNKNKDLWERLKKSSEFHDVTWSWVRGHSINKMNQKADVLAELARINFINTK